MKVTPMNANGLSNFWKFDFLPCLLYPTGAGVVATSV